MAGIPKVDAESAKMLERKPLVVIIYTLASVVALLFGTLMYKINDDDKRIDSERTKNDALSREIIAAYKDSRDAWKDIGDKYSPEKYYQKNANSIYTDSNANNGSDRLHR